MHWLIRSGWQWNRHHTLPPSGWPATWLNVKVWVTEPPKIASPSWRPMKT
ncbi:hypothetical protein [Kibdelosporangium philippinense]